MLEIMLTIAGIASVLSFITAVFPTIGEPEKIPGDIELMDEGKTLQVKTENPSDAEKLMHILEPKMARTPKSRAQNGHVA